MLDYSSTYRSSKLLTSSSHLSTQLLHPARRHKQLPGRPTPLRSLMESNKDEALKCLAIAQRRRDGGDLAAARRFCQKSLALFETPEARKLLEVIEADSSSSSSSSAGSEPFTSSAETHPSASGARQRHAPSASDSTKANGKAGEPSAQKKRDYTPEQASVVKRVRTCKVTQYYEILSVQKDCEEADIKKAYRKVRSIPICEEADLMAELEPSWHCRYILTRMVPQGQMRHSRVRSCIAHG